jgi:hypothetical protein
MSKFAIGLLTLAMYAASLPAFVPPYSQAGPICPGIARGIDCKVWPPPIDEDPDRKRGAGGG